MQVEPMVSSITTFEATRRKRSASFDERERILFPALT
jgi:hypothetical protein